MNDVPKELQSTIVQRKDDSEMDSILTRLELYRGFEKDLFVKRKTIISMWQIGILRN